MPPISIRFLAGSGARLGRTEFFLALLLASTSLWVAANCSPVPAEVPRTLEAPPTSSGDALLVTPVPAEVPLIQVASPPPPTSPIAYPVLKPVSAWMPLMHMDSAPTPIQPLPSTPSGVGDRTTSLSVANSRLSLVLHRPYLVALLCTLALVSLMFHQGGTGSGYRTPPAWGPEVAERYPFRHWARDVLVWSILTDLDARRKTAAVILQLRGGAQELVRSLPPQAIIAGGVINGTAVDPMTFLMHALSERYAQLGEET